MLAFASIIIIYPFQRAILTVMMPIRHFRVDTKMRYRLCVSSGWSGRRAPNDDFQRAKMIFSVLKIIIRGHKVNNGHFSNNGKVI